MFYIISKFLFSQFNPNSLRISRRLYAFVYVCSWHRWRACPAVSKVIH